MRRICLLALAAALYGCQQKQPSPPASAVEPPRAAESPAPAPDTRPAIVCFGDSLTAGFGLDPGQSFPDLLQHDLDSAGYRYRVVNLGVSGDTTEDGLARIGMVTAEKPAVVVVEFGANDGLRGQPLPHIEANLAQIVETLRGAGTRVLLAGITLPPNYGADYIHRFDAMYRDLAARYKLPLIPFLLVNVAGDPDLMQRDAMHPNARGARIVTATVWRALQPMLQR
jgi:acyl-CoA thioesterase I